MDFVHLFSGCYSSAQARQHLRSSSQLHLGKGARAKGNEAMPSQFVTILGVAPMVHPTAGLQHDWQVESKDHDGVRKVSRYGNLGSK